ncbi:unnamed protein product, partial [Musa acuminata subsp. burmannicoides]
MGQELGDPLHGLARHQGRHVRPRSRRRPRLPRDACGHAVQRQRANRRRSRAEDAATVSWRWQGRSSAHGLLMFCVVVNSMIEHLLNLSFCGGLYFKVSKCDGQTGAAEER